MATLGIPNLCGANPDLENVLDKINKMADEITANLNLDASVAAAAVQEKIDEGLSDLKKLVPELPSLPSTNLQAELTSLLALSPTSLTYAASLAKITADFGSALTAKGLSLDTLLIDGLSKIAAGGDVCGLVPNMEIEPNSTEVKEKAAPVGLASTAPTKEVASVINTAISIATKANAAMEERAKTATTAGGAMEALISSTVGAIDRMGGTVSPTQITEMKKLDTNIKNSIFGSSGISWPAINKALDSTDTNQSFESDIVTEGDSVEADSGNVAEMPAEDDSNEFNNEKKKVFHTIDKAFEKYVIETKHAENSLIRANAAKGYPHNIVGTSSLDAKKMYVIPPKEKILGEAARFGNYNYEAYVHFINKSYKDYRIWKEDIKESWNRGFVEDDALKYGAPSKSKNPTLKKNIISAADQYVKSVTDSISPVNDYHKEVKQLMEVPIKQPEATTRDSHVPVKKPILKGKSALETPTETRAETIARMESLYSKDGLKVTLVKVIGPGRIAALVTMNNTQGKKFAGIGTYLEAAILSGYRKAKKRAKELSDDFT